ncbi:hypothetical protein AB0L64_34235 [Kribbella sp. NPDC051936]|uniref:hypothetical protein n=1 Tax=Kribbella sp. NPDC051936 TaxID=3154946 RepID=UPI003432AB46
MGTDLRADAAIALGVVPVGMAWISHLDAGPFQWKYAVQDLTPELSRALSAEFTPSG